jgi:O-acetyl-ADP-ribose deacetylase (regulator of RNase III)
MGSGVALAIKNIHPQAYLDYVRFIKSCRDNETDALGKSVISYSNDKIIINAITQEFFGRDGKQYVDYQAITRSLTRGIGVILHNGYNVKRIAIPTIGAGLGGGNWEVIKERLYDIESLLEVEFIIYSLET